MKPRIFQVAVWMGSSLLFLISAPSAYADPVTITGGSLTSASNTESFSLTGDGFLLSGGTEFGIAGGGFSCQPCSNTPPVSLSLSGLVSGPGLQSLQYNGVTYSYPNDTVGAFLQFTTPTFSSAALSPTNLTVTEPFTLSGLVNVWQGPPQGTGPLLFSVDVVGTGMATAQFSKNPSVAGQPLLFATSNVTYDFAGASPSPTPEPASIVLLGVGMLGAVVRRQFVL